MVAARFGWMYTFAGEDLITARKYQPSATCAIPDERLYACRESCTDTLGSYLTTGPRPGVDECMPLM